MLIRYVCIPLQLTDGTLPDMKAADLAARGIKQPPGAPGESREPTQCQLQIQAAGLAAARDQPHRRGRLRERHPPQRS